MKDHKNIFAADEFGKAEPEVCKENDSMKKW